MKFTRAKNCAWRAVYLYRSNGRQVAFFGVDALWDTSRTRVFMGVGTRWFAFYIKGLPWSIKSRLVNPTYWRNGRIK